MSIPTAQATDLVAAIRRRDALRDRQDRLEDLANQGERRLIRLEERLAEAIAPLVPPDASSLRDAVAIVAGGRVFAAYREGEFIDYFEFPAVVVAE